MRHIAFASAIVTALSLVSVQAQRNWPEVTAPEISPIVTWDSWATISRPPTKRPLTPAELRRLRARAETIYDLVKVTPTYRQFTTRILLMTAWPVVRQQDGVIQEDFLVYLTRPPDARRRPDGSLWPKVGGAHELVSLSLNGPPGTPSLRGTGDTPGFWRAVDGDGPVDGVFDAPRVHATIAGGTLLTTQFLLTRDGRSVLEPAPLAPLLEQEIARHRTSIEQADAARARTLAELEASMTPAAKSNRRARRAESWKNTFRNPDTMARELDAADKSDESSFQQEQQRLTVPVTRDPGSVYWGPRLARDALAGRLASLNATERSGGACWRRDATFRGDLGDRFEPAGSVSGCEPLFRVRRDLVDPKTPNDVQLLRLSFGESACGAEWAVPVGAARTKCDVALALLRELDWSAVKVALGW